MKIIYLNVLRKKEEEKGKKKKCLWTKPYKYLGIKENTLDLIPNGQS